MQRAADCRHNRCSGFIHYRARPPWLHQIAIVGLRHTGLLHLQYAGYYYRAGAKDRRAVNSDLDLAEAALAAYSNPATVETARVHAYIAQPAGGQIVALRGTNPKDLIDLALDAEMI